MSLTRAQAVDEILAILKTAWETTQTSSSLKYENVGSKAVPPDTQVAWARSTLRHTTSRQASLSGVTGQRRFRRNGVLVVQVFEPTGKGLSGETDLAEIIRNAYEGVTTAGGVVFNNVTINEIGTDGDWYQVNITIPFEYDEVR